MRCARSCRRRSPRTSPSPSRARNAEPEILKLAVDDAGESWVGTGKPVTGDAVMVKVNYDLRGEPHEVEIPFVPAKR